MLRKIGPLFVAVLIGIASVGLLAQTPAHAKTLMPNSNQYGLTTVQVSTHCPAMQTIVDLPIDSQIHSMTISGNANGSVHLKDKVGAIDTIASSSYSFTTSQSDQLNACTIGGSTSTVSFQGQLNMYTENWAGYTVEGYASSPNI